jgi:hypothetical protein
VQFDSDIHILVISPDMPVFVLKPVPNTNTSAPSFEMVTFSLTDTIGSLIIETLDIATVWY